MQRRRLQFALRWYWWLQGFVQRAAVSSRVVGGRVVGPTVRSIRGLRGECKRASVRRVGIATRFGQAPRGTHSTHGARVSQQRLVVDCERLVAAIWAQKGRRLVNRLLQCFPNLVQLESQRAQRSAAARRTAVNLHRVHTVRRPGRHNACSSGLLHSSYDPTLC